MDFYEALLTFLVIGLFMGFVYFTNGRSLTEKVLAIDFMSLMSAGLMLIYAVTFNDPVYLDVVIVWALVSFLGAVAFIFYVVKDNKMNDKKSSSFEETPPLDFNSED
jgi:multicomponent Na+:H+ antiporter subunit F